MNKRFIETTLQNGTKLSINLDYVENIYRERLDGKAVVVMVPVDGGQRVFETDEVYRPFMNRVLGETS